MPHEQPDPIAQLNEKLDALTKLVSERTANEVDQAIKTRQEQTPRWQGLLSSFRVWTAGLSTAAVGVIQEYGINLTEDQKTWLSIGVAVAAALLIYSDTHRKIGE